MKAYFTDLHKEIYARLSNWIRANDKTHRNK